MIIFNANTKKKRTTDCVVRAISYATGLNYDDVMMDLAFIGNHIGHPFNARQTFKKYLAALGIQIQETMKHDGNHRYYLYEFIRFCKKDEYTIVSLAVHLSVVHNAQVVDTWDPSYKAVGNYWTVTEEQRKTLPAKRKEIMQKYLKEIKSYVKGIEQ